MLQLRTNENGGICCSLINAVTGEREMPVHPCVKCAEHFAALRITSLRVNENGGRHHSGELHHDRRHSERLRTRPCRAPHACAEGGRNAEGCSPRGHH